MTQQRETSRPDPETITANVRERYGRIADGKESGCCGSSPSCCGPSETSGQLGYREAELAQVPDGANLGLGCGTPIDSLDLQKGEIVLDLGSGGGLDAFLAAARVGTEGHVIGVDMTPEMISRARENASKAGLEQVEFRQGRLESLPVEDATIDAVTSNCVINLVPDKSKVFREIARVLKPGGRLVISDIVLNGRLPESLERNVLAWVGCISGALQREHYFEALKEAGFETIEVLNDVDYIATIGEAMPDDLREISEATGVRPQDIEGRVHSITYRATRS